MIVIHTSYHNLWIRKRTWDPYLLYLTYENTPHIHVPMYHLSITHYPYQFEYFNTYYFIGRFRYVYGFILGSVSRHTLWILKHVALFHACKVRKSIDTNKWYIDYILIATLDFPWRLCFHFSLFSWNSLWIILVALIRNDIHHQPAISAKKQHETF